MKRIVSILFFLSGLVSLTCCGGGGRAASTDGDTVYMPRYASGFMVTETDGGRVLEIIDPWQGAEGVRYRIFLSREGASAPEGFEGITVAVPLEKVVCMSSSYVAFIDELGRASTIKGISGGKYISDPGVRAAFREGKISEVGYDSGLDYELLAAIRPDAVFAYGLTGENSVMSSKLAELGIKVIYIGDYVEQSPLGKAEWLVAFGYLYQLEEQAVERFEKTVRSYNALKELIADNIGQEQRPVVMLNSPYRDTWFVPGDGNYMVRLVEDAGGRYACAGEDSPQTRPISLEEAYVKMLSSDIWLNPGQAVDLAGVKAENPRFISSPPLAGGRVYNNNNRTTPEGGSDFWESGAVRPDAVLTDLVKIFHPGLLADNENLYYYRKLE
ncbi:MAG: ABC transporter substrate-binding protein [Rikenellaceae bacterium]|nr:ABC transporter substrate-binding protein [Rikenellaceae bacterium]